MTAAESQYEIHIDNMQARCDRCGESSIIIFNGSLQMLDGYFDGGIYNEQGYCTRPGQFRHYRCSDVSNPSPQ